MKKGGGRLVELYYHTGEFDGTVIAELPDDAAANAVVLAAVATGAYHPTRTTRLYTIKDVLESLSKSGKISFEAPGTK